MRLRTRVKVQLSALLATVLLFLVTLPAVTTRLYSADEIEYFAFLRSMWFDHDLSFENEYQHFYDRGVARAFGFHQTFLEMKTETGRRFNFGTMGSALLWAPMYGVADLGVRMTRKAGTNIDADGYSRPYIAAVTYGSAFYGFVALLLSSLITNRIVGHPQWAPAVVWLGTPLLFYMYLAPGMSHACSAFAVAAFILAWLAVRERWSLPGLVALGALGALMTMVREQDAFYMIGVAVDYGWTWAADQDARQTTLARLKALLAGAATFAVCFLPQAWAYVVLNGRLAPASPVSAKMRWAAPHALEVLFSPRNGFFFWTPLAVAGVAGLIAGTLTRSTEKPSDKRQIMLCLLVMFAAQVYVGGSVDTWTVAGSFGQRRFVGTSALLIVGLAGLLHAAQGWKRVAVGLLIVLSVWWNLGLMAQFGAGLMDRQALELRRNAYNTFVVVPRDLPRLAYRYLFNRASFYQSSRSDPGAR